MRTIIQLCQIFYLFLEDWNKKFGICKLLVNERIHKMLKNERCSRIAEYPDHCVRRSLHKSLICWLFPCLKNIFTVKQPLFLLFHSTSWQKWHVELLHLLFMWDCKVTAAKLNFQPASSFYSLPSAYLPQHCQVQDLFSASLWRARAGVQLKNVQ